jgi:CheY-like chemotaxis protein
MDRGKTHEMGEGRMKVEKEKIYIVEDDLDLADMLHAYFEMQGYAVEGTTHGEDAVAEIRISQPDVVLLDIRLPDIDGFEVCRRLRKTRRTANMPIIFLTEKRERESKLTGLELGAVDYITKPFDIQELRLRVRNALRRTHLSAQINPVTSLPEGDVVVDRVMATLAGEEWGAVLVAVRGLDYFRDRFGFVAADDVMRAVTLMIANVVKEHGLGEEYLGHGRHHDYLILTHHSTASALAEACFHRLRAAMKFFYPAHQRSELAQLPESQQLRAEVTFTIAGDEAVENFADLLAALYGSS